jgi:hypothetical protein
MALRSPTPFHNFWGITSPTTNADWIAGELPNEGTPPFAGYYGSTNVEIGDFAYVSAAATFYVCTVAGTAAGGGATWVQITTGSPTTDRFAPKYLIGGPSDTAAALTNVDGFNYIPYTGWQAALAAVWSGAPGDVHFRPGTFTLAGPLTVPADCSLRGAGQTTIFSVTDTGNGTLGAFVLGAGSTLSDCAITALSGATGTDSTTFAIVDTDSGVACVENVIASYTVVTGSTTTCKAVYRVKAAVAAKFSDCDVTLTGTATPELPADSLCGWLVFANASNSLSLTACSHTAGDAAVVHNGAALSVSQFTSKDTTSVGIGVYSVAANTVNIVNSKIDALSGYAVDVGSATGTVGMSNNYLTTADNALAAFQSAGSGRVVGNSILSLVAAVDTSLGLGHAIGFNVFSGSVTTAATDEVAHNI